MASYCLMAFLDFFPYVPPISVPNLVGFETNFAITCNVISLRTERHRIKFIRNKEDLVPQCYGMSITLEVEFKTDEHFRSWITINMTH